MGRENVMYVALCQYSGEQCRLHVIVNEQTFGTMCSTPTVAEILLKQLLWADKNKFVIFGI